MLEFRILEIVNEWVNGVVDEIRLYESIVKLIVD